MRFLLFAGASAPRRRSAKHHVSLARKENLYSIGRLERFVSDMNGKDVEKPAKAEPSGKKVAVVGSGPAGLNSSGRPCKNGSFGHDL